MNRIEELRKVRILKSKFKDIFDKETCNVINKILNDVYKINENPKINYLINLMKNIKEWSLEKDILVKQNGKNKINTLPSLRLYLLKLREMDLVDSRIKSNRWQWRYKQ